MSSIFYRLGRMVGPQVRKARWVWQSMTGSEAEAIRVEGEVGRDLAQEVRRQLRVGRDAEVGRMLNEVGSRLAGRVANKLRTFSFEMVEGGEPNAFALPGGYVFVTRSLLELCEWNRDEVAFILAHEMGHVIRGHAMERIISNSAIALGARAVPIRGTISALVQKMGVRFFEGAYSRDLELEADKLGGRLAVAAGYKPEGAAELLSRLAKSRRGGGELNFGHYFSSHPSLDVRIQNISGLLRR